MENKNSRAGRIFSILAACLLIAGGLGLAIYFLGLVPNQSGITVWRFLLCDLAAFIPVFIGGIWLGVLYRRDKKTDGKRRYLTGGILFGILLVLIGLVMLGFGSEVIPPQWRPVIISWQMLLILVGFIEICKLHVVIGFVMVILGKFFIIPRIAAVYPESWLMGSDFTATYWPMLLIAFGLLIILSLLFKPKYFSFDHHHKRGEDFNRVIEEAKNSDGVIDYNLVFTGSEQVFLEPTFRGGEINTVFAGMNLDLRRTTLPQGITYLKIDTVFGGVEVRAPEEWNIEIRSQAIFGGFTDRRLKNSVPEPTDSKLVIIVHSIFGGGEIK